MTKNIQSHYQDFNSLDQWLNYLENLHVTEIDLGLGRIGQVFQKLNIDLSFATVITVAGTNGKGTTCAFIENAILSAKSIESSPRVAVYSSPHITLFNERLRIDKQDVTDEALIEAFQLIERVRGDISLSYYEYTTLAALLVLMQLKPAYIILEVGLGGRLDATNIIDANIAVLTAIDLDHQAFLGNDRETIGFEKAGIMREEQKIVVGDTNVPNSVLEHAYHLKAQHQDNLFVRKQDFDLQKVKSSWQWQSPEVTFSDLTIPYIPLDNVATAVMVLSQLELPLSSTLINEVIEQTKVPGRTELIKSASHCDVILDVGHNPHATRYLSTYLKDIKQQNNYQKIHAVVSMLSDKDIEASLLPLKNEVSYWYTGELSVPRAASIELMRQQATKITQELNCFDNVIDAYKMALERADIDDVIVVFGSFFTVADIRSYLAVN